MVDFECDIVDQHTQCKLSSRVMHIIQHPYIYIFLILGLMFYCLVREKVCVFGGDISPCIQYEFQWHIVSALVTGAVIWGSILHVSINFEHILITILLFKRFYVRVPFVTQIIATSVEIIFSVLYILTKILTHTHIYSYTLSVCECMVFWWLCGGGVGVWWWCVGGVV